MIKKEQEKQEKEGIEESAIEDELIKLREELEACKQAVQANEEKYRRALADYQNLQKRSIEERQTWIRSANKELLLRILTVLDTLILAYQHGQDQNIQVSINQFLDILKAEGVVKIEAIGKTFDPNVMEVIATGEGKEGEVTEELRTGFLLHDKLLRAAQVKVGSAKQN